MPQGGPPFDRRLDDLERHRGFDVAARLDRARRLEAEAEAAGDVPSVMRARLVMADMLHRSGDPTAMRLAVQVNDWATTHGARPLIARSHLVLSGMFYQVGDPAASLDHAVRAMDLLDDDTPPRVRGNHLLQLGDALSIIGSTDEARQRYHEAEAEFAKLDDPERQVHVLNNLAVLEQESGHIDAALEVVERLTERVGSDISYPEVADTIARVQLAAGDLEAAERTVAWGDRLVAEQGGGSRHVMAWLALAGVEIRIAQGRLDEAVADLDRCLEICAARNLAGVRVQALQVRANL
ncbi:MAG: tetratricopeptide repeat protein, partial [Actinomycetales bacterium]|nr:tetratricopeptide repeat protein [Actinomycetales bacterium]